MKPVWMSLVASSACLAGCSAPEGTVYVGTKLAQSTALDGALLRDAKIELPTADGGTLLIERVRLAVGEMELDDDDDDGDDDDGDDDDGDDDDGDDDDGDDDDGDDDDLPGRVVEVALDGSSKQIEAKSVAEGRYGELELELQAGGFPDFDGDPLASIIVDGSYDGSAFSYRSQVAPELEFVIQPAIEVRQGAEARIAVTFDVAAWFLDPAGNALDPRAAEHRDTIEAAILASMREHAEVELD